MGRRRPKTQAAELAYAMCVFVPDVRRVHLTTGLDGLTLCGLTMDAVTAVLLPTQRVFRGRALHVLLRFGEVRVGSRKLRAAAVCQRCRQRLAHLVTMSQGDRSEEIWEWLERRLPFEEV
jgi:hypothetical protein